MKALSIRQPWAWLIIHGGKDIENRTWHAKYRGRFLVHASQGMTKLEYKSAQWYAAERGVTVPPLEQLQRGGIIGSVELVDSVDNSNSPWYMGEKGFVLRDPKPLPFVPLKGRLGFFDVSLFQTNNSKRAHCPHCGICHTSEETCTEAKARIADVCGEQP